MSSSVLVTDLSNQLALITGATGGIGYATALALAKLKCNIAVHYHANSSKAKQLASELEALGVKVATFQADLSSYDETRILHKEVVESIGHPTILLNNAGVTAGKSGVKDISEIDIEDFEKTWRANCATSYLLTQLCIPPMVEKGFGRIIFTSSVAGLTGGVIGPHYASSKSALHGLIHWLSKVYSRKGITVNGIAPALIDDTAMLPGNAESLGNAVPIGRIGKPEEIAETVIWMVKTGYVTNKVIAVDGGMFIQ